jgi:ubiquinol-cytochrome c reductase cytochrome c1 subunit
MKKLIIAAAVAFAGLHAGAVQAVEGEALPARDWSFSGIFGQYDRGALQRGLQVYQEVCSGCHSLRLIAFRNLDGLGFNEDEIKAIAAEYTIEDGPDDEGEMFERAGVPADRFPSPFANSNAAAAANSGAVPPDLSLMTKARDGGADYLHALLIGYVDPPDGVDLLEDVQSYNLYFPGNVTAMAPPLFEDAVEYGDGTPATVEQMASDVTSFLAWAAEPEMEDRKRMGIKVILFLLVFTGVLYAVKRKVWADLH